LTIIIIWEISDSILETGKYCWSKVSCIIQESWQLCYAGIRWCPREQFLWYLFSAFIEYNYKMTKGNPFKNITWSVLGKLSDKLKRSIQTMHRSCNAQCKTIESKGVAHCWIGNWKMHTSYRTTINQEFLVLEVKCHSFSTIMCFLLIFVKDSWSVIYWIQAIYKVLCSNITQLLNYFVQTSTRRWACTSIQQVRHESMVASVIELICLLLFFSQRQLKCYLLNPSHIQGAVL